MFKLSYKLESVAGEKNIFALPFGKKKKIIIIIIK